MIYQNTPSGQACGVPILIGDLVGELAHKGNEAKNLGRQGDAELFGHRLVDGDRDMLRGTDAQVRHPQTLSAHGSSKTVGRLGSKSCRSESLRCL